MTILSETDLVQIFVYVPEDHLEAVKAAMFAEGAGKLGEYEACAWQTLGQGQFRPGEGANPYIGSPGLVEKLPEWKLEMICPAPLIKKVVLAMRQAHPYEEPAFGVLPLL